MRLALLATCATLGLLAASGASAANLVANGSFEVGGLSGWTIGGTDLQGYPPAAITYGAAAAYPTGAFGEAVPANNAPTISPDAVGTHAAYFVTDFASGQSLSQTITVATAGNYRIGFSAYAPANGYGNVNEAFFSGSIAGVTLANYAVSTGPVTAWQTFSGNANLSAGSYDVTFLFSSNGYPAKDVVIDQVYVVAAPPTGVPAPAALGLLCLGLLGLGAIIRRRA